MIDASTRVVRGWWRRGGRAFAAAVLGALALGLAASAEPREGPRAFAALTEARHDLELSVALPGAVAAVPVTAGQRVKAGEVLIELDRGEAARSLALAELRAASTIDVEAAKAEMDLAENELARMQDAETLGGASPFETERKRLEAVIARLRYELAVRKQQESAIELEQVRLRHDKHVLRAPMDGIVEEVRLAPGEMADPARPVVRLVVIDPLRVYVPTDVGVAAGLRAGMTAQVKFSGPGAGAGEVVLPGVIVQVAAIADPGSDTRTVTVEIANPLERPAGLHVEVVFEE